MGHTGHTGHTKSKQSKHTSHTKHTKHNQSTPFYSLTESVIYESDPDVRIVYFTEKGIDLLAAVPEYANIEHAIRRGYSWNHVIENGTVYVKAPARICIVKTTEAELDAHKRSGGARKEVDHKALMLAHIDLVPLQERTQERLADVIFEYMIDNNITDMDIANQVCEIVIRDVRAYHKEQILARIEVLSELPELSEHELTMDHVANTIVNYMREHKITEFTLADEVCEIVGSRGMLKPIALEASTVCVPDKCDDSTNVNVSIGSYISAWLVSSFDSVCTSIQQLSLSILPIPTDMNWIVVD